MHGLTHDWIVMNTIKNGKDMPTGEQHGGGTIREHLTYEYDFHLDEQPIFKRVLEVGSQNVNGSTRDYDFLGRGPKWLELIGNPEYIGIDIAEGKDVDIVMNAHKIEFEDNYFDLVICVNTLEHDEDIVASLKEMLRVCAKGGVILISVPNETVPQHFSEHYNSLNREQFLALLDEAGYRNSYYACTYTETYHDHLVRYEK